VPKSRSRKKADFTPPPERRPAAAKVSGRWVAPAMVTFLIIGLVWIVLYYVASGSLGFIDDLGAWNVVIWFAFIFAGLMVATRWR